MPEHLRMIRNGRRLAAATVVVLLVRVGLWLLPFETLQRILSRFLRKPASTPKRGSSPDEIGKIVKAASRFVPRATCLTQALTAQLFLMRQGHPAELRIGVVSAGGRFEAHAWVESGGQILIGNVDLWRYKPLPTLDRVVR